MSMSPYVPLPGESPSAFEAFTYWFNLKVRKLKIVAENLDISIHTIKEWSSQFRWNDRLLQHKARLLGESAEMQVEAARDHAAKPIHDEHKAITSLSLKWLLGMDSLRHQARRKIPIVLPNQDPEYLTVSQTALRLNITERTLLYWMCLGRVPFLRSQGCVYLNWRHVTESINHPPPNATTA